MPAIVEKQFELTLRDPNSSQFRSMTVAAPDAGAAKEQALASELKIVNFSLLPPEKEIWEHPPGTTDDDPDGLVDMARWDVAGFDRSQLAFQREMAGTYDYDEAVRYAKRRVDAWERRIDVGSDGKVRHHDLSKFAKAQLIHHRQSDPFEVAECVEVTDRMREISDAGFEGWLEMQRIAKRIQASGLPDWDPQRWSAFVEEMRQKGYPTAVLARIHGVGVLAQDTGGTPIVWGTGTGGNDIYVALLTSFTADPDTQNAWDDISATQVTGTGYTANGVELAGKAVSYDSTTDQTRLDANDAQWLTSTISAQDAAVYNRTPGSDATREIYGTIDFEATVSTTAGTFQIT